jgi:hypothetical protein
MNVPDEGYSINLSCTKIEDKMVDNTNIYRKSNVFLILSSAVKTMPLRRMHTNDINLDFYHDVLHWLYK